MSMNLKPQSLMYQGIAAFSFLFSNSQNPSNNTFSVCRSENRRTVANAVGFCYTDGNDSVLLGESSMNRARLFSSGALFLFAVYCLIRDPDLPFSLPHFVYIVGTAYFAVFPIKDLFSFSTNNTYKGRQFSKYYEPAENCDKEDFSLLVKRSNRAAVYSMLFWLAYMSVPTVLYLTGVIGREWIFFFFALSNFAIFYAVFGWCPINKLFFRSSCCNECRVYNWDSFFQYSFLILIPNVYTVILFSLDCASLIKWEIAVHRHPERFYKMSNACLSCEKCDMESCKKNKKKFFSKKLK